MGKNAHAPDRNILFGLDSRRGFTTSKAMTDSQKLLSDYAETGSESAFQELVTRYINFVYATALRLVDGDTQLAERQPDRVYQPGPARPAPFPEGHAGRMAASANVSFGNQSRPRRTAPPLSRK